MCVIHWVYAECSNLIWSDCGRCWHPRVGIQWECGTFRMTQKSCVRDLRQYTYVAVLVRQTDWQTDGRADGHTDRQIDSQVDRWQMDGQANSRMGGWTDRQTGRWMNEWTDRPISRKTDMNRWLNETDRQAYRQMDKWMDWRIDRHTDKQTDYRQVQHAHAQIGKYPENCQIL